MILIPQRLFGNKEVKTIFRDGNVCLLEKQLSESLLNREGYTGRSVSTFRREFKDQFQMTPKKWLKEKRIEKAIKLIDTQTMSVTELAYEVGYENISYFIKAFKLQTGLSPKQYILSKRRNNLLN